MARGGFLCLIQTAQRHPFSNSPLASFAARLNDEPGWQSAGSTDRMRLWVGGKSPPKAQALGLAAGFVVGDVFQMPGQGVGPSPLEDPTVCARQPVEMARRLSRAHWGRYVAILHGPPVATGVFRDPSGALPCLVWPMGEGLHVVTSDLSLAPSFLRPPQLALNWRNIARYMALPAASTTEPLFDGISAVGPGELQMVGEGQASSNLIWSPADFVRNDRTDLSAAGDELVRRVDASTHSLARGYERLMVEVSGGLDSAIVAAAISETGLSGRVTEWINRAGDREESDERAYAQAVTDRIGVNLTVISKPRTRLDAETLAELGGSTWPAITASDAGTDRDIAARLSASRTHGLVSGQGGDAVFFQMPSALIMADALRRDGPRALLSPLLPDVARRTRQSVWSVLRQVRAEHRGRAPPTMTTSPLVSSDVRTEFAGSEHRWVSVARSQGVSPAKRLQIEAIANCQVYLDDSRRHRIADPLFPLLAQPVVELCLAIAAPDLAGGAYDRTFTRTAFAERLPDAVRKRRSKGNMSAFFSRLVAENLDTLRPHLIDGCLCEAGILDRAAVERSLDAQHLIWTGQATEILWAATVESWVRHWQGRVPDAGEVSRQHP